VTLERAPAAPVTPVKAAKAVKAVRAVTPTPAARPVGTAHKPVAAPETKPAEPGTEWIEEGVVDPFRDKNKSKSKNKEE
jgi:hypothetical protein